MLGNKEIQAIREVFKVNSYKVIGRVLEMTTADIKANRIAFGKKTSRAEFMDLFNANLNVYLRSC